MLTIHGEKELDKVLNCEVKVLNVNTQEQINVSIGAKQLEVLVFHDYLNVYRIPLDYYIRIEEGKMLSIRKIWEDKIDQIFTRHDIQRPVRVLRVEKIWFGEPSCDVWYEKDYVVSKIA